MRQSAWTTPADIRAELQKRWQRGQILAASLVDGGLFPLRLALKQPSSSQLADDFIVARNWVESWQTADCRYFQLEWREINNRQSGRNRLPAAVVIATANDAAALLKKTGELSLLRELTAAVPEAFAVLHGWLVKYPLRALDHAEHWRQLLAVCNWMVENPRPGIYLRQISLPGIDSKFIEGHKKLLAEWLDLLLPAEHVAQDCSHGQFEARYGFSAKPQLIRFRLLDPCLTLAGLTDLSVTAEEFAKLDLPVQRVFITENDINGLVFPAVAGGMVIFGRGYGFEALAKARWLEAKDIHYWGDIDSHGFAILSQFRRYFPHSRSLLMDEATLLSHRGHWVTEASPSKAELEYLHADEAALYAALRDNRFGDRLRLEQEYVQFNRLIEQLASL